MKCGIMARADRTSLVAFDAALAALYWIGDGPISNVPHRAYVGYLYFSMETLSTAGYGDMHPQSHCGRFIATIKLFAGIFSMSLMTGVDLSRDSRAQARAFCSPTTRSFPVIRRTDTDGVAVVIGHDVVATQTVHACVGRSPLGRGPRPDRLRQVP